MNYDGKFAELDQEFVDLDQEAVYDQYGRRITEADVEAAADAAERGDVDMAAAVYPGGGEGESCDGA